MKNCTLFENKAFLNPVCKAIGCIILLSVFFSTRSFAYFTPVINTQPSSVTVCQGSTTSFTVAATGTSLTYQWQVFNGSVWTNITNNSTYTNATTASLTVTGITSGMNGLQYRCNVSDGVTVTSAAATLGVNASTAPVVRTTNKADFICANGFGSLGTTTSTATGFQWQFSTDGGVSWANTVDGAVYSGSATGTLSILSGVGLNGFLYHYIATGSGCSATSALDTLYALSPTVTTSPSGSVTVCPGNTTITATPANGLAPYTCQWFLGSITTALTDVIPYSGTGTTALGITGVTTAMNGNKYKVTVTDAIGCQVTSSQVTLVVPSVAITVPPASANVCAGSTLTLSTTLSAVGGSATRRWQTDGGTTALGGPVVWTDSLTTTTMPLGTLGLSRDGYHYRVIVTSAGACNSVTSPDAIIHVGASGTWLGAVDTNWHIPGNWCGGVPISTTDVLVPNWAPRMPTISNTTGAATWQSIKIENTAGLRITGGSYPFGLAPSVYNLLGSVSYIADADQNILPATHGTLIVGASMNKFLQANTNVLQTLGLGGTAKLITGNFGLTMKAGSNPISGAVFNAAASSWIVTGNGSAGAANTGLGGLTIEQIGSSSGAVIFPVGPTTAAYNPAMVTNTGVTDNYTLAVNDQRLPGSIVNSGVSRTWKLGELVAGGSNVALQLQWNVPEEESQYVHTSSQILRSDGISIVQYTSVLPVSGSSPFATSGGTFSSLTQFSVASYTLLLPIRLNGFAARRAGALNQIDWQVDGQEQPSKYILERSADGVVFNEIAGVNALAGKSVYTYADSDPGNAVTYYRLKMLTVDGKNILYSRTVTVTNQQGVVRVELRPSVTVGNETNLFIILPQKTIVSCTLTDAIGRVQLHTAVSLEKGAQTIPLQLGRLAKGIYYLRVAGTDGVIKLLPLVKQ